MDALLWVIFQILQHILQPFPGIDVLRLLAGQKGIYHRRTLRTLMGTAKQIVLAAQGYGTNHILDQVVINLHATIQCTSNCGNWCAA